MWLLPSLGGLLPGHWMGPLDLDHGWEELELSPQIVSQSPQSTLRSADLAPEACMGISLTRCLMSRTASLLCLGGTAAVNRALLESIVRHVGWVYFQGLSNQSQWDLELVHKPLQGPQLEWSLCACYPRYKWVTPTRCLGIWYNRTMADGAEAYSFVVQSCSWVWDQDHSRWVSLLGADLPSQNHFLWSWTH